MTEPTRKRQKGRHAPELSPVPVQTEPAEARHDAPLLLWVTGGSTLAELDFEEFAAGSYKEGTNDSWGGDFSARPILIRELFPFIASRYSSASLGTAQGLKTTFRWWWRLFDQVDSVAPVRTIADIHDGHAAFARQAGVNRTPYLNFQRLVNAARKSQGIPELHWPPVGEKTIQTSLPEERHVKAMYTVVKHRVHAAMHRWEVADKMACEGENRCLAIGLTPKLCTKWTDADKTATYRGAIEGLRHPCPDIGKLNTYLRRTLQWPLGIAPIVFALYPSLDDVRNFFLLFLIRTGWNSAVARNIDISDDGWISLNPISPMFHIVRAVKDRGKTVQVAIGIEKSQVSPGNLIRTLLKRTEPLRLLLKADLNVARQNLLALEAKPQTAQRENELMQQEQEIAELEAKIRSPWLFVDARDKNRIGILSEAALTRAAGVMDGKQASHLQRLIAEINSGRAANDQIPKDFAASDFRDAYLAFVYRTSGHNWLVAMLAAGHKSVGSLKAYLRQRQWRAHSAKKIVEFGDVQWQEIIVYRRVEPAVTHAKLHNEGVTHEQIQRWLDHKDRTRVGMGCKDFKNPPRKVAPHHVAGRGCRVQRCTLCEHGIIFDDSMDMLVRRLAELSYLKSTMSLSAWHESTFAEEFARTEYALTKFDAVAVQQALEYWETEFREQRQVPFGFEGAYES